jgi:putative transposase
MLFRKAFQFRLEPIPEQRIRMAQTAGCVRLVWNKALGEIKEGLDRGEKYPGYVPMANKLKDMKRVEETAFLKLVHSQPLQQTLKDLDRAVRDGFKKTKGFPRFKKKSHDKSFRYPQGVKIEGESIYLPKIGWVSFRKSREIEGIIKNTIVRFDCGEWYVSVQTEFEREVPQHPAEGSIVGLDMGIKSFVTSSEGQQVLPLNSFKKHEKTLAKEQRSLARKQKGSSNRTKQIYKVQKIHKKIRNCRKDFLHKAANQFCKNHAVIVLEDLKVKNMSASAKGSLEEPGRRVRQKSGLNKAILDQGWYQFRQLLIYKQEWMGGSVVMVPPQYTSQRCSKCSHVSADNRKTQEDFVCVSCGYRDHADVNASKNIKAAGSAVLACGGRSEMAFDISPVRASAQESPSSEARVSG